MHRYYHFLCTALSDISRKSVSLIADENCLCALEGTSSYRLSVLVDDSRSAVQMVAFGLEYRNTAASAGNDNMIRLNQRLDRTDLHDLLRLRAGHNAAPAAAGILDDLVISLFYINII